jgi:hypothetical protein
MARAPLPRLSAWHARCTGYARRFHEMMPFSFMDRFRVGRPRTRIFQRLLIIARATLDVLALALFVAICARNDRHDRRHRRMRGA